MSKSIMHHAVEEEARLMRVIMRNARDESSESIKIMQEHNWVLNFFKSKLVSIERNGMPSYTESPNAYALVFINYYKTWLILIPTCIQ